MPVQASISNTRRSELTKRLAQLAAADNNAVPKLLSGLAPPLSTFDEWQPTIEELSNNIQKLLSFAEAKACFAMLEAATQPAKADPAATTPAAALTAAQQVAVTQPLKDALVTALLEFGSAPTDLKASMESALRGVNIAVRVAWLKSMAEVSQQMVDETEAAGMLAELIVGFHLQKPRNRAFATFVRTYYPMLYRDPIAGRTLVPWATRGSAFDAILVARRTPFVNRRPLRDLLNALFSNPNAVGNIITINGPSRAGKSYVSWLIEFLVDTGMRGHPETVPHTPGQHRFALLRPTQSGALHTVNKVAAEMLSQLGWKHLLPDQHKSDDGWAQEVVLNFRNELTNSDDVVWIVADKYWDFADPKVVIDFFVALANEAHLLQGRDKLRLVLIDFPQKPLDDYIQDRGSNAQFENIDLSWLTPEDIEQFCNTFANWQPVGAAVAGDKVFDTVKGRVNQALTGAELQQAWCNSLRRELAGYW